MTDENVSIPNLPSHWMLAGIHPDSPTQAQLDRIEQDVRRALAGTAGDRWAAFTTNELHPMLDALYASAPKNGATACDLIHELDDELERRNNTP